jgi:DNA-binding transcriptional regulator YiaG
MLWEQIRTVLPIFAFLIGYQVRVLREWEWRRTPPTFFRFKRQCG